MDVKCKHTYTSHELFSQEIKEVSLHLKNKIIVATHHKAGTTWLVNIFRDISKRQNLKLFIGAQENLPPNIDVFLQDRRGINLNSIGENYKGVHLIRDPRDIIISGCFYHQNSVEKWLHVKEDKYGGTSYHKKINSYKNIDEQIMLEMETVAYTTIQEIRRWSYNNEIFIEFKYEDLIKDYYLILFHKMFIYLGIPGGLIPTCLESAYNHSLFSGKVGRKKHIHSGAPHQWKYYFKSHHKKRFIELFGDVLIELGYEPDNDWVLE